MSMERLVLFDNRFARGVISINDEPGEWVAIAYTFTCVRCWSCNIYSRFRLFGAIAGFAVALCPYANNTYKLGIGNWPMR